MRSSTRWAWTVPEKGTAAAEAHGIPRPALQSNSQLDVAGGQHKHREGRQRGAGQLDSMHSRIEEHGCPPASSLGSPAGTGGTAASAGHPASIHSPAKPTAPKPARNIHFSALKARRNRASMSAGLYIVVVFLPNWLSAFLSCCSGGGRLWPGGEGWMLCQPQPHTWPCEVTAPSWSLHSFGQLV